jgi:hypothetical protein
MRPTGLHRLLAFLHPVSALLVLALLLYVASLGLRSRERGEAHLRRRHARLASYAYGVMLANVALGLVSTWHLRVDLALAGSAHFRIGLLVAALFTAAAVLSRRVATSDSARLLHPLLGLLGIVLSAVQIFFGMPLLPL